jgi:ATP-dependent RNA helicase DDX24/MAK5
MEIDLSDSEDEDNPRSLSTKKRRAHTQGKGRAIRAELEALLRKPLMMRGVSAKYLTTRGTAGLVDQLISGKGAFSSSLFPFSFFCAFQC